jgi:hypothetical protein
MEKGAQAPFFFLKLLLFQTLKIVQKGAFFGIYKDNYGDIT